MPQKTTKEKNTYEKSGLFKKLAALGETFEPENYAKIIQGNDNNLTPELIAFMQNEDLVSEDSPGKGLVPVHAVNVLKELEALEAIEPLLELLPDCIFEDYLFSSITVALKSFGTPVLEPVLTSYEKHKNTSNADLLPALSEILAHIGVNDARIFPILLSMLDRDVEFAARLLATYGDPAAVPLLSDTLDETSKHDSGPLRELAIAIETLGGTLSRRQEKLLNKSKHAKKDRRVLLDSDKVPAMYRLPKPGVNIRF